MLVCFTHSCLLFQFSGANSSDAARLAAGVTPQDIEQTRKKKSDAGESSAAFCVSFVSVARTSARGELGACRSEFVAGAGDLTLVFCVCCCCPAIGRSKSGSTSAGSGRADLFTDNTDKKYMTVGSDAPRLSA